jgi:hypothetical protein
MQGVLTTALPANLWRNHQLQHLHLEMKIVGNRAKEVEGVMARLSPPQALRSGAIQALDSLVNLPPEGGSRRVIFTRPLSLETTCHLQ